MTIVVRMVRIYEDFDDDDNDEDYDDGGEDED